MAAKVEGDEVFKVPIGRAPQGKRSSLPAIEISKATRSSEQGRMMNHDVPASRSFTNILQVKDGLTKTLSASNLAALSDSNLSIQEAVPARSYDAPYTSSHIAKKTFEQSVKRYYYQLTEGCGDKECPNKFCFSSQNYIQLTPALALLFSIELAASNRACLCKTDQCSHRPLPKPELEPDSDDITSPPFIYSLYSTTPFQTLFREGSRPPSRSSLQLLLPSPLHHSRIGSVSLSPSLENLAFACRNKVDTSNMKTGTGLLVPTPSDFRSRLMAADDSIVGQQVKPRGLCRQFSNSLGNLSGSSDLDAFGSFSHVLSYSLSQIRLHNALVVPSRSISHSSLNENSSIASDVLHFDPSVDGDFGDNLEELERQLQLELSYGRMQEFSLTHLNIPMLQCALEKYSETLDPSFLLNTIRTVFTSSESLNLSFKKEESLPIGAANIDLKGVRQAYELLMKQESLVPSLRNSIEIVLSHLPNVAIQPQEVNQLAILLECPLFRKRRNHALRQKLCVVLSGLLPHTREAFCEVLIMYDAELFEKRMGMLKDHLMLSLRHNQRSEPPMIAMAETLLIFYEANALQEKKTGTSIIPYRMFYVGELGRKLDYKAEYECWCKCHLLPITPTCTSSSGQHETSLLNYSFLLDPSSKVHALHLDAVIQMRRVYQEAILHQARVNQVQKYLRDFSRCPRLPNAVKSAMCPYLVLEVRREHLINDTITQIRLKEVDLKKPLKIKYIGGGEQGLDMGGLQKEFFQLVCTEIFDRDYGMFLYSEETRNLWFNGASIDSNEEFELVGILLGLAIYNGIILDIRLPLAIYKKLQGHGLTLSDLSQVQPVIYNSLVELLAFEGDVEDTFCLTFQASTELYGELVTVDLIPNGAEIMVTTENRHQYVKSYILYLLTESISKQFIAFKGGFHKVCDSNVLSLFRPEEIELLVCGSPDFDFDAFERSASYDDGYHKEHRVIKWFWIVVHEYTPEQKRRLLHFITGSDRVPLKGLSHLPIIIQRNGSDSERLPAAMTCFNRFLLPEYSSEQKVREKITIAIENGKGFGLQ